jgi:hypothetical protein
MTIFNSTEYGLLLGRLDANEIRLSDLRKDNKKLRLDSAFFSKQALQDDARVKSYPGGFDELGALCSRFVKGIFDINANSYVDDGVPFVRILNLKNGVIDESNLARIPECVHAKESKTALNRGDIVLSKTAIAAASLVTLECCNVSQDTIAVTLSEYGRSNYKPEAIVAFLNTAVGLDLLMRQFQGNVQLHLGLDDGRKVPVPRMGFELQEEIATTFQAAEGQRQNSLVAMKRAEAILGEALGLGAWKAPDELSYESTRTDVLSAGRFDAQFFAPRNLSLLALLGKDGQCISDVAQVRREKFKPEDAGDFNYLEIGGVRPDGSIGAFEVPHAEAPSRAAQRVRADDVITSTVRPIRRLSALIQKDQDGFVCSSGFVVLDPTHVAPAALLVYLRLPLVCELMDLFSSASMYPAISERDLLRMPIPVIDEKVQKRITAEVEAARLAKLYGTTLVNAASDAVAQAMEHGEKVARQSLKAVMKKFYTDSKNPISQALDDL